MAHDHRHHHESESALADLLDLDGRVLRSYWTAAFDWVAANAPAEVQLVLDLGAGSGVGTFALAERYAAARVTAVDVDEDMLRRISDRVAELDLADRVRTVAADLDAEWPELEPADITWASNSLHHLQDPGRALAALFGSARAGGVVAVAEFNEPLRFLPDDLGDGLEARVVALSRREQAHELPHLGSDWSSWLTGAGFDLIGERDFTIDLADSSPDAVEYGLRWLRRLRTRVADRLTGADGQLLGALVDEPDPGLSRMELHIRGVRTVTLARRP
jgi:SAM-dependent methyltransferase